MDHIADAITTVSPRYAREIQTVEYGAGLHGVLSIGHIGHPVCQTHVDMNKIGMILIGGLNPVAAVCEEGLTVDNKAMSTVMEFEKMRDIETI